MQVQSLGQEHALEQEMATHSSILAWKKFHGQRSLAGCSHGVAKSQTQLSTCRQQQNVQFCSMCHLCTLYNQDMKLLHYHKETPSCYSFVFTNLPPLLTPHWRR